MARMSRSFWGAISIVTLLLLTSYGTAEAAKAHTFTCNECHKSAVNAGPRAVGNFCVTCHTGAGGTAGPGPFTSASASDALGSHPLPSTAVGSQTSHFWGASKSAMPAAGSVTPTTDFYFSRNAISTGLVTCSLCHDPHGDNMTLPVVATSTPNILRYVTEVGVSTFAMTTDDLICKQCHSPYYQDLASAALTHPVGAAVVLTNTPLKFNYPAPVNIGLGGNVQLVNGYVSCTSCHNTHFADSDSTTVDGIGQTMKAGDGKLLRTDGALVVGANAQDTANRRSAVCSACHPYKTHGNGIEPVGCLSCHSAHVYTAVGTPNYYVLRKNVTTTAFGAKTDMNFTTLGSAATTWADGIVGSPNGYCEKCHGDTNTMAGSTRTHSELTDDCRTCHAHNRTGAARSFEATGCDGCHGFPPATNVVATGYAAGYTPFKDESLTPHASHSGATSGYSFSCGNCHNAYDGNAVNTHNKGTYQDVLVGTQPFNTTLVRPAALLAVPTYATGGSGTCTNVACHSNGGKRKRVGDLTSTYVTTAPTWANGKNAITTCDACHGNDAATMGTKNNSVSHIKHLNAGYTCNICHSTTAASNTALTGAAAGTTHVDGLKEVVFSGVAGGGSYASVAGTCAVVCHGATTPDWDLPASGACGACHQYSVAGVATGTGTALTSAHNKHLYAASNGVQLACTICHTNNGTGVDHVNGSISYVANYQNAVCNVCHGATNGVTTGIDRQPIWGSTASVDCSTCHAGTSLALVVGKTATSKTLNATLGHGKGSIVGPACTGCHDSNAAGHFDGITGDDLRLTGGSANNDTFCKSCHAQNSHYNDSNTLGGGSTSGDTCAICHEAHGEGMVANSNTDAMLIKGFGFTDKTQASSYFNASRNGVCQVCHVATDGVGGINHYNKTVAPDGHNATTVCTSCHAHTATTAFVAGAGTACNDCHGNPPATAAHQLHATTAINTIAEDRTDCAKCHTGANLYTYDPATDRTPGGGSLNHGNAAGRLTLLSNTVNSVGYNDVDGSCSTACHKSTVADGFWTDTILDCNACHYQSATPTSAANSADAHPLTGTHNQHFAATTQSVCNDCHAAVSDMTHITDVSGATDLLKITGKAQALQNEATVTPAALGTGSDPDPGNPTCNNVTCHNPSNGAFSATWAGAAATCSTCHSNTDPGTGSHNKHMTAAGTFGINTMACTSCHVNNGTNNAHRNGSVTFAAGMNYTPAAVDVGGIVGSCSTVTCHNNGTAAVTAVPTPNWGVVSSDCTLCHGNAPATGAHASHVNATYVTGSCGDCHTAATATTHINGTRNMANKVSLYTAGATQTCTNSCHIANTVGDWNLAGTLACTDCHGSGKVTTPALDRGWPPATGGHAVHIANTSYVTGANCVDCHTNNTVTHSTLNNVVTTAIGTKLTVNPGNGSCTNSCHLSAQASDWTGGSAAITCTDCHTAGTFIGSGANMPTSGLHAVTPTITAQRHDQTVAGGCAACHNTVNGLATHINGAFAGDTMSNLGLQYYTQTAANTGTCLTTCHTSNSGDWAHKWMATANYTSPTNSCQGCHGTNLLATGLGNTGVIHRPVTAMHNTGTSYQCRDCHGLEAVSGTYTFAFGSNDWGGTSKHGDGIIEINSNTATYNDVTGICATCHTAAGADGIHNFQDTSWTVAPIAGDTINASCGSCHTGGKSTGGASGAHNIHGSNLSDETTCYPCHGNNSGSGYSVYTGTHSNGSVTFSGVNYSTAIRNVVTGTCSTTSCHDKANKQSAPWSSANLDCNDCHYYAAGTTPTTAGNTTATQSLSSDHANHFGTGGTFACATCHGTDPIYDTHMTLLTGATLAQKATPVQDNATVTVTTWVDGTNTCSNTACHNPSSTTYSAIWQTSTTSCTLCHSLTNPGTGSHVQHMTAAGTFGINTIACTSCHGTLPVSNSHLNNTVTFAAGMNYTPAAVDIGGTVGKCTTTTCHNDGTAAVTAVPTTNWGVNSVDCTLCHGNAPATGAHASHVNATYVSGSCNDCHTAATATTHINGTRNITNKVSVYTAGATQTCTNSCHIANTVGDWNPAGTLACADCHGSGKVTVPALDRGFPPSTGAHLKHTNSTFYVASNCVDCHTNNTVTHSTLNNAVTTAIGTKLTINPANGSCTNSCHVAAQASDWTGGPAAVTCIDCHSGTYVGTAPTSGLHTGTLTISNNTHDNSFSDGNAGTATCVSCHTATPSTNHINGTFTSSWNAVAPSINFNTSVGFTDAATPTCGPNGVGYVTCHDDGGTWKRKWSVTAKNPANDDTVCANCHGDFASGFVTGVAARHQTTTSGDADGQIASGHDGSVNGKCSTCHNYIKGNNSYYNIANFPVGQHRDGSIQINSNVGFNASTIGCSKCHADNDGTADEGHQFVATTARWTRALIAGVPISCASCHAYPPDPADGKAAIAIEGKGAHTAHIVNIAAEKSVTLNPTSDAFVNNPVCGVCHNVSTAANHTTAGGPRSILIPATYQFGPTAPAYNGIVDQPSAVTPKNCSNVSCHFKTTPVWE